MKTTESGYINNGVKTVTESTAQDEDGPFCPCHNQPCVWTSYNPELWNEPKTDHYSCPVTKERVDV